MKQEKKKKGRRANLWWLLSLVELLEAAGSGAGCGAGGSQCFFSLFLCVFFFICKPPLFFYLFYFFFRSLRPLFPFLLLRSSEHVLSLGFFFFLLSSPVFIGKNKGRDGRGGHCSAALGLSKGCVPSIFHRPMVGHGLEFMQVGLWSVSF